MPLPHSHHLLLKTLSPCRYKKGEAIQWGRLTPLKGGADASLDPMPPHLFSSHSLLTRLLHPPSSSPIIYKIVPQFRALWPQSNPSRPAIFPLHVTNAKPPIEKPTDKDKMLQYQDEHRSSLLQPPQRSSYDSKSSYDSSSEDEKDLLPPYGLVFCNRTSSLNKPLPRLPLPTQTLGAGVKQLGRRVRFEVEKPLPPLYVLSHCVRPLARGQGVGHWDGKLD